MIDLHSHILPNIDDGAKNYYESLDMLNMYSRQNVKTVVCTPHYNPTKLSIDSFINLRDEKIKLLQDHQVELIPGSETFLHAYLLHNTDLQPLCIGRTRYLLLEMAFDIQLQLEDFELIEQLELEYDVIPIIAHIERYQGIKKNNHYLELFREYGCVLQVNASAFLKKDTRKRVIGYLKQGYVDVIGSDSHNIAKRAPNLKEAFQIIEEKTTQELCNRLLQNAEDIIQGKDMRYYQS